MPRIVTVGAAQLGPIAKDESRKQVVERLLKHLHDAKQAGCDLVVFPELALITFFPRWFSDDQAWIDRWFEREMPGPETRPLFEAAAKLQIGFALGYAELIVEEGRTRHFNTAILVDKAGRIVGKYRKVHLPGHANDESWRPFQHLEKRYFDVGNLGFRVYDAFGGRVGMLICNDRRWPEAYRCLGLQGVEMVLIGYNTPVHHPHAPDHDRLGWFHNQLVMQAGAYQNSTWVVGVAKTGAEEGVPMVGSSQIIAPSGETVAMCRTEGDELAVVRCDLDAGRSYKETTFNFAVHRQPQAYALITATQGPVDTETALRLEGRALPDAAQ
jgi:N-carbamoyl-D-amino-acid hydrolase